MEKEKIEKTKTKKKGKKKPIVQNGKEAVYELFCEYMALPSVIRSGVFNDPTTNEPIETQGDFAKAYGVKQSRLSEWKRTDDYSIKVSRIRRQYFKNEIGDAIQALLAKQYSTPTGADVKVLLEYTKEIERDDPTGETGETLTSILKKLDKLIPG